jgi:hypothetical protein
MAEIADKMINGEYCAECGVYLAPKEEVYVQATSKKMYMPKDESPAGFPVICYDCFKSE